jgi:hypothetical protein
VRVCEIRLLGSVLLLETSVQHEEGEVKSAGVVYWGVGKEVREG